MRGCRLFGKRSLSPLTIVPVIAAGPSLKNLFLWTRIPVLLNVFLIGSSGILVGSGHKVEAAAVEVDGGFEVGFVAKAPSRVLDPLNL